MFVFYIITILISVAYLFLLTGLIIGWKRISIFEKGSMNPFPVFISIVIAARNEENTIFGTLMSISNQSLDTNSYEVLIVDDFSSDETNKIIEGFCQQHDNFSSFTFREHKGKKYALDFVIQKAKGKLIVSTDADCKHQTGWLQTIRDYYISSNAKMIIAPVLIKPTNWFEHMQALDFMSLMVSGAAASGIQKPMMNNGANLAFTKKSYIELNDPLNQNISSGDDIFLLINLKKKYKDKIHFLKAKNAIVYTKPQKSFKDFISQRKRWASKSRHYRDFDIVFTAITVFSMNMILLSSLISIFLSINFLLLFLVVFSLKSILDIILLHKTAQFFEQNFLLRYFFHVQLANIFLVPFIAFSGLFTKTKWKGKSII